MEDRYKIQPILDFRRIIEYENNKDVQLSYYNDTMKKFLAFYFKAMSKVLHPRIVADEIIHSIELVYNELNTTNCRILRLIVGNDSKNIHSLKNI